MMSLRGEVVTKRDNVIKLVGTNFQNKSQEKAVGGRTCQRKMRSTWTPSNFVQYSSDVEKLTNNFIKTRISVF